MRCCKHLPSLLLTLLFIASSPIASASATCSLKIGVNRDGVPMGQAECKHGTVTMAFTNALRLSRTQPLTGIQVSKACSIEGCLVAICNSKASFESSTVRGVQLKGWNNQDNVSLICVQGNSNITFNNLTTDRTYGSAVVTRDTARVLFSNSTFSLGAASGGAGLLAMGHSVVTIKYTVFSSNSANGYYGGGGLVAAQNSTVLLQDSLLTNNTAFNMYAGGGAVVIDSARLTISNTIIRDNYADGGGAGVAAYYGILLVITDGSKIINNNSTAGFAGGGLAVLGNATVIITGGTIIANNTATGDSGGGVYIQGEGSTLLCNGETVLANNTAGGNGGGVYAAVGAVVTMGDESGSCLFQNNTASLGWDVNGGQQVKFKFDNTNINIYSPTVIWSRTECFMGETLQLVCTRCESGTYSFNPKNGSCDICPSEGAKCPGGDAILPVEGWWHSSNQSTQFHRCPHTSDVCLHGGGCAEEYSGNLCGACADNYASNGPFHCVYCGSMTGAWVVYILVSLVSVVLITITAHATWRDNQDGGSELKASHMLHVVIMLGQYLVLISSIPIQWPAVLGAVFRVSNTVFGVFGGQASSLDCILRSFEHLTDLPVAIMRQLATLFAPIAMFIAVNIVGLLWFGLKGVTSQILSLLAPRHAAVRISSTLGLFQKPQLVAKAPILAMVVLSVAYPFLVRMSFGFFACIPLDNSSSPVDPYPEYAVANAPHGYWVYDMQQACWSGYHLKWATGMGIPCVAVFCIAIPAAIFIWLFAHAEALESDTQFKERYGLLYRCYRPKRFWYESLLRLFMSGICAVSAFRYALGPYYATLLMNGGFGVFCGSQILLKPYISNILGRMQLLAFACLYFITYVALTLITVDTVVGPQYKDAAGILALICVGSYVVWCLFLIVRQSKQALLQLWRVIRQVLCLGKQQPKLPSRLAESVPTQKDARPQR